MKKWTNESYTAIALYAFLTALACLLFYFVASNLGQILLFLGNILWAARAVIGGAFLALVLFPLAGWIERLFICRIFKKKPHPTAARALSVSLTFLILLLVVAIIVVSVLPILSQNYDDLRATIDYYVDSAVALLQGNEVFYNLFSELTGITGKTPEEIIDSFVNEYAGLFSAFANSLISVLTTVIYATSDVIIAVILAFYFLLSREKLRAVFRKAAFAFIPSGALQYTADFFRRFYTNLMEFFSARLLCSFVVGVLCYFLTWAMQVPFYPLIALIVMVLNIVPVIGPVAAAALSSLVVFIVKPEAIWLFLAVIVGINILEGYLVEHHLLPKRLRPSIAAVLIAVMIGYVYWDFLGAVFAVPVWVTVRDILQLWINRRLHKKKLSVMTSDYISQTGREMYGAPVEEDLDGEANGEAEGQDTAN